MPIAVIVIAILTAMSMVSVCQSYLLAQVDKMHAYSSYAQVEADNAVEIVRRDFAHQIANHIEVADVKNPTVWQERHRMCDNETKCEAIVENIVALADNRYLATPSPSDTPIACDTPLSYDEPEKRGFNACNLAIGGQLNEERRVVTLRTVVHGVNGVVLASANRQIRFRLFRLSPYAQVVGIKDEASHSTLKTVPDMGGFDSTEGTKHDTLLRSYAPCRDLPKTAPTPISDRPYYWGDWVDRSTEPPILVKCKPNGGDTSHFQNGSVLDKKETNGWDEAE